MPRSRVPKRARQAAILAHVRAGSTRRSAAALANVPFATFYEWLEQVGFSEAVTRAEAEFEQTAIAQIERAAGQGSWRAKAWLLERRLAQSWQERKTLAVEGDFGDLADATLEERQAFRTIRQIAAMTPEEQDAHDREMLFLSVEHAGTDTLLGLRDRIAKLLSRTRTPLRSGSRWNRRHD